jgi:hypothetical protein
VLLLIYFAEAQSPSRSSVIVEATETAAANWTKVPEYPIIQHCPFGGTGQLQIVD